jgi:hypothetical protein
MASGTGSSSRLIVRAATAALLSFALLPPAYAQFWGNSWGGRQQQPQQRYNPYAQQPYNPYGGFGGDRQWGYGDYRQWGPSSPRQRDQQRKRPREVEKERPPDYSRAPPATPREDAMIKVVVMGDANADWLAYGLEDAFSEKPEIGIVRKHRTDSGLIRYDQHRDSEWPQVAREIITAEKPKFVVMMIGNNDRQTIREKAPPPAPANAQPIQPPPGATVGPSASEAVAAPGGATDQPNVNAKASTPEPINSISNWRSAMGFGCRTSWYSRCSVTVPLPCSSTSTP